MSWGRTGRTVSTELMTGSGEGGGVITTVKDLLSMRTILNMSRKRVRQIE